jgi:IclR family KDG regulon transcriptional repressor
MARLGQHMPLLLGASSRILLAYMEPDELNRVLKANTAGTDFDRAAFDREVARFRRQGFALTRGQRVPGLTAIAAPIFDIAGHVPHCLALTGPSVRIDPRDSDLSDILVAAGRDISNRLGASPEHALDLKLLLEDSKGERTPAAKKKPPAKKATTKAKKTASEKAVAAAG